MTHYTHQHVISSIVIHSCKTALFTSQLSHHRCMYDVAVSINMCLNSYHILKQALEMTSFTAQTCDSWWTHHSKQYQSSPRQCWKSTPDISFTVILCVCIIFYNCCHRGFQTDNSHRATPLYTQV